MWKDVTIDSSRGGCLKVESWQLVRPFFTLTEEATWRGSETCQLDKKRSPAAMPQRPEMEGRNLLYLCSR